MTTLYRQCKGPCQKDLELNEENFDRDSRKEGGFRFFCKKCRAEARKLKQALTISSQLKILDDAAMRAVHEMPDGGTDMPHVAELYRVMVGLLGGVQGFGRHYVANMLQAPPGSQTRQRMLADINKLAMVATASGAVDKPVSAMTDEDLLNELKKREVHLRIMKPEIVVETIEDKDDKRDT